MEINVLPFSTQVHALSAKLEADKCTADMLRAAAWGSAAKNTCVDAFWEYVVSNQGARVPVHSAHIFVPKIRICPVCLQQQHLVRALVGNNRFWNTCTTDCRYKYSSCNLHLKSGIWTPKKSWVNDWNFQLVVEAGTIVLGGLRIK